MRLAIKLVGDAGQGMPQQRIAVEPGAGRAESGL
jgi:hypothetical protein